eukprot:768067-Hanusia_phi.AAC.2
MMAGPPGPPGAAGAASEANTGGTVTGARPSRGVPRWRGARSLAGGRPTRTRRPIGPGRPRARRGPLLPDGLAALIRTRTVLPGEVRKPHAPSTWHRDPLPTYPLTLAAGHTVVRGCGRAPTVQTVFYSSGTYRTAARRGSSEPGSAGGLSEAAGRL